MLSGSRIRSAAPKPFPRPSSDSGPSVNSRGTPTSTRQIAQDTNSTFHTVIRIVGFFTIGNS